MDSNLHRSGIMTPVSDLSTAEKRLEPFAWYASMREQTPVRFDKERNCWDVFLYEDVRKILLDAKTFSSERKELYGFPVPPNILSMDPPRHTQLRMLVNQAFTPKAVAKLAARIERITNELFDVMLQQKQQEEVDFVRDLAYPLPVIVITELLGVPSEDREYFKHWSDLLVKISNDSTDQAILEMRQEKFTVLAELARYFIDILEQRRKDPRQDLVTALLQAEVDGEKLEQQDIISFCILLLAAGNETTTNLIGNSIRCFSPDVYQTLRSNPELLPTAIEEVLRFRSPVQATNRYVTRDVQIGDALIREGDQVVAWIGSANRDSARFEDEDHFILTRDPNPHLAFGHGIHFCIGAPLARLEAQIALSAFVKRIETFEITESKLEPIESGFVYGVKRLPMRFTK